MPVETWTVGILIADIDRSATVPTFEAGRTMINRLLGSLRASNSITPTSYTFAAEHLARSTPPRAVALGGWVFADGAVRITLMANPGLGLTPEDIKEAV